MPEEIEDHEELVRALVPPRWDQKLNRISASAFVDSNSEVSVSRTSVLPYEEIKAIFIADLHKPPEYPLQATVSVSAGEVRKACKSNPEVTVSIRIIPDEIKDDPKGASDNPAHAVIESFDKDLSPKKLSRGMSQAIIRAAKEPVLLNLAQAPAPPSD